MRKLINNYLVSNSDTLKNKIKFIFNDLWSFDSKDLSFSVDLSCRENMTWGYAYGCSLNNYIPIVYNVSFFNIGRLEQLRKFFGYNKKPILIISAGAFGYDKYGWEHSFKDEDDIKLMKELKFTIKRFDLLNCSNEVIKLIMEEFLDDYIKTPTSVYLRLPKDLN